MQSSLRDGLVSLAEKGIKIDEVLIRDIKLPTLIQDAINAKKVKAQEAEKEKESLNLFIVKQQTEIEKQKALAESEKIAANKDKELATIQAETATIKADNAADIVLIGATAEAEAKRKVIDVLGREGYIQLQAMKSLEVLQNGNHIIFADPNSNNVMPFMNLDKVINK